MDKLMTMKESKELLGVSTKTIQNVDKTDQLALYVHTRERRR